MITFVTVIYVIVCLLMVLGILLQSGRGGGLSGAFGGGTTQSVFGGGGGGDFMSRLTQSLAALFMLCAVYLAYAGTHSGSEFLREISDDDAGQGNLAAEDEAIDYERIGPNPLTLPTSRGAASQDDAAAKAAGETPTVPDEAPSEPGSELEPTLPDVDRGSDAIPNADPALGDPAPGEPALGGPALADPPLGDPAAVPAEPRRDDAPSDMPARDPGSTIEGMNDEDLE